MKDPSDLKDLQLIAQAMLQRAAMDLDGKSPKNRSDAYYFLTNKDDRLVLWCKILGVTPEGVSERVYKSLRKFELDNKKGGATLT